MEIKGHQGTIRFDGTTIVLDKSRRGQTRIAAAQVTSIDVQPAGIGMKAIKFTVAGGSGVQAVKVAGGNKHRDFMQDPYALTFRSKHLPEFESLIQEIEQARASS